MLMTNKERLGSVTFSNTWEDDTGVRHTDARYADRVNFWRDIISEPLYEQCLKARAGDVVTVDLATNQVVPGYQEKLIRRLKTSQFRNEMFDGGALSGPRFGRFYPQGLLSGVTNVFSQNMTPFRCVGTTESGFLGDLNHPMAGRQLQLKAEIIDIREKFEERGGTSTDWLELLLSGPGMQTR